MKRVFILSLCMLLPVFTYSADTQKDAVLYTLSMPKPANHLLEVEATFKNIPSSENVLDVLLPVWRPGRYLVLDLANGVQNFSAADEHGAPLPWKKSTKSSWRVETRGARALTVRYSVYANDFDMKTRGLDIDHAFVSGESVFMYTDRHRRLPIELTVRPFPSWHVTTGLDEVQGRPDTFTAPSYDYFIDCPLEIGTQHDYEFTAEGKRHTISLSGRGNWNADTLIRDVSKIVSANKQFWGRLPYEKFVFFIHCLPFNGGGVEHLNSTIIGARSYGFRDPGQYGQLLSLISHEFFHTWNVKQVRPRGLHPYDFQRENYSRELWIAEGTTSYYGPMMLVKAGLRQGSMYMTILPGYINEERSRPGNAVLSLSDASYDAWIKYWKGNENAFNAESDYYGKGAMASLLLDLEIRHRSGNKKSLDDVMRLMFERFPLSGAGYTVDDFRQTAEECAGGSLKDFFARAIDGTAPLPWDETLLYAGLSVRKSPEPAKRSIGMTLQQTPDNRVKVSRVVSDSPAEDAGLQPGDEVVALNSARMPATEINDRIGEMKDGDQARIAFFRDGILREAVVTARSFGNPVFTVQKTENPSSLQRSIYERWLGVPWQESPAKK
ncbi:MAG: M61 family metallopeptidase [Acidobacteriota bacterium]